MKTCMMVAVLCAAGSALADPPKKAPKTVSAAELKWTEWPDSKGAVHFAPLWGDLKKGAFGGLYKWAAGFEQGLHSHTSVIKVVVLSGTMFNGPDKSTAKDIGPGSWYLQPAGVVHQAGCRAGAECMFFIESPGKLEMKPAEAKKD